MTIAELKLKSIQEEMSPAMLGLEGMGSCVFRLRYGDRYVIVKGRNLSGSVYLIQKGLAYFLVGGGRVGKKTPAGVPGEGHKEGQGKNTFYFQFYSFVKATPGLKWMVEIIIESDNGYQLLKREQMELTTAIKDKMCMNSNVESYIPKFRTTTFLYGDWIKPAHVLCFKKFLKQPLPISSDSR